MTQFLPPSTLTNIMMFEEFPIPLVVVDSQGEIVAFSAAMNQVWDYSETSLLNQNLWRLLPQAWQDHLQPAYKATITTNQTGYAQIFDAPHQRWWQVGLVPKANRSIWLIFWDLTTQQEELIWHQAQLTELRRWYDRLQTIAEISQQVFWEWHIQDDTTLWVGNTVSLFGYPLDAMPQSGQAWLDLIHPDDVTAVQAGWESSQSSGAPYCCEYRVRCQDGHYAWVRDCSQYFHSESGEFRLLGAVADISSRKDAEAAIASNELRFKNLVANLPGHVFRCANDPDWTIQYLSDNIEQTVGYPAADFINNCRRTFASIIHPDDQQYVYDTIQEIFKRQNHYGVEYRVIRADGQVRWFYESGQAIHNAAGEAQYIDGISIEITVQKQAELELAQSESRFRQLVEDVAVGIIVHNPQGEIILANERAANILGLSLDQLLGKSAQDLDWYVVNETGERLTAAQFPSARATEQLIPIRDVVLGVNRPSQDLIWLQVTAEPHFNASQQLEQVVITLSDITQRKQVEDALRYQSQREQTLNRVIKAIRNSLNLAEIFQTTVDEIGHLLNVDRVAIVQYRPELGQWDHIIEYLRESSLPPSQGLIIPDAQNPIATSLKQGQTVQIHQAETEPNLGEFNRELATSFPGNWLMVPLQVEAHTWGSLTLQQSHPDQAWHPSEVSLLEVIADQLAVAIRQAELYQSLQAANQELSRLAITDDLTQIANRRHFDECLAREWNRLLREQAPLSLVFCDVDDFKAYNDLYGHQTGDECLYLVAQALGTTARRAVDLVARYGGEEFAIILPHTDGAGASRVVENIQATLKALEIPHAASRVSPVVTVSFGISTGRPTPESSPVHLLEAADQALYQAKAEGRNTYRIIHVP
ncbi:diguanylate cyclase domain-containing protein [Synechococcus sp. PCC 6312]|uniref:diguanylate cyclase domain-containing protein n=1 Tax=Synechococcus sp. (strain ATCC 27167 / PCC 6312) TaxID=195253 RepID=UPI0002EDB890|nr:diguanylate cyclase [Synechococcus sp. PCC 6312]